MELSPYLQSVADDLDKVTALADDATREVTRRLITALEPGLRMALVQAISDATAIVSADLDDVVALVRMEGRDPVITVDRVGQRHAARPSPEDEGDDSARVTVRLPQGLKQRAEERATASDQSLNAWMVQTIRQATHEDPFPGPFPRPRVPGSRRVTGWA